MTDSRPLLADKQYHYKVVIVGDSFTGKSSLLSRLSDKEFERAYAPTIGVDYVRHSPILCFHYCVSWD
jgi:GTPase SAR1 family protein